MTSRIARLRSAMQAEELPALLVMKPENIYYLSGFSGSDGALIVTEDQQLLVTDFRYFLQAEQEAPDWKLVRIDSATSSLLGTIRQTLADLHLPRIGFSPDEMTVAMHRFISNEENGVPYALVPVGGLVEELRLRKDADELLRIRDAVAITDAAYTHLLSQVQPGVTEGELALEAEWYMRRHGADGVAFDIIVATGDRSALPHAQPGPRPLQPLDLVVVDMGARVAHYCADMTRTFAVSDSNEITRELYRVCLEAQLTGVERIRAGMTGREADGIVREVIERAGYGERFGHGTGHGVGLEIHEAPRLSLRAEQPLPVGATVTIEPGIYLPDLGGVRIEDLVVLTETGLDVLTAAAKPTELPVFG